MFGLGVGEIGIILFIALVFIGPKKLPELAKGLGKGMREFQNAMRGVQSQLQDPMDEIRNQIQSQANAKPRGSFQDDPEHDQNMPDDEEDLDFVHEDHASDEIDEDLDAVSAEEAQELEEKIAKDLGVSDENSSDEEAKKLS